MKGAVHESLDNPSRPGLYCIPCQVHEGVLTFVG